VWVPVLLFLCVRLYLYGVFAFVALNFAHSDCTLIDQVFCYNCDVRRKKVGENGRGRKERFGRCTHDGRGGAHRPIGDQMEAGGAALKVSAHENVFLLSACSRRLEPSLVTKWCKSTRT
jgi:hypothetical protein